MQLGRLAMSEEEERHASRNERSNRDSPEILRGAAAILPRARMGAGSRIRHRTTGRPADRFGGIADFAAVIRLAPAAFCPQISQICAD
jgi:hypothetical protein